MSQEISDFRNDVRITLRTRNMASGFLVVDELAVRGVPLEPTIEFVPNSKELAEGRRARAVLEVLERSETIANAESEVVGDIRRAA